MPPRVCLPTLLELEPIPRQSARRARGLNFRYRLETIGLRGAFRWTQPRFDFGGGGRARRTTRRRFGRTPPLSGPGRRPPPRNEEMRAEPMISMPGGRPHSFLVRLNRPQVGVTSLAMAKSVVRMIFAFIVALAVAMPANVRAMPMAMFGDHIAGMAGDQPCRNCSDQHQSGSTAPDKMPICPAFACITAPAVLPAPAQLTGPIALRADYARLPDARLAGADPAPDPFPPRPIVLD